MGCLELYWKQFMAAADLENLKEAAVRRTGWIGSRECNRGCYWKGRLGYRELESAAVELLQDLMQIKNADWVGLDAVGESSVGRSILVADWLCWLEW
ncbi:hypothetical protein F0562_010200 [Nyssa sinensis]|uniref:Uncharacterized protein n=1 Tax=Nyssa sinensis TaxID=561372 RepID=A0A5J5A377_9ASTE|nr:hypothetical protein F0562_010200 [Nyssa sinensis]